MEKSQVTDILNRETIAVSLSDYMAICVIVFSLHPLLAMISGFKSDYFDVAMYVNMTLNNFDNVTDPYAPRVLGPILARLLVRAFGIEALDALLFVNMAAFYGFVIAVAYYLFQWNVPLHWAAVIGLLPYNLVLNKYIFVPDATAVFFLFMSLSILVSARKFLELVAIFGALSILARNELLAVYALLAIFYFFMKDYRRVLTLISGCVLGAVALWLLTPDITTNVHQMNPIFYFALKLPANFITNILGVNLYTNTYQWCTDPINVFDVSFVPFIGDIKVVGYCAPDFQRIFDTFFVYLTVLGAWPFLIGTLFVRKKMNSVDCMFAVTFLVFFVAAACVGRTVERLFLYSYPALVIIVPWFVMKMESPVLRRRFAFVTGLFQAAGLYFIYFHV